MNNSSQSSLNVQITQTKLRIANLQNQIQHQQTQFLKQQPGHQGAMPGPSQSGGQSMQPNNQSQIPQSGGQSHLPTPSAQTTQHKPIPPITQSNHAQEVIQHGLDSEFRDLTIKDFGPQQAGRANASSGSGIPACEYLVYIVEENSLIHFLDILFLHSLSHFTLTPCITVCVLLNILLCLSINYNPVNIRIYFHSLPLTLFLSSDG